MLKNALHLSLAAALLTATGIAFAATASTPIVVTATVKQACSITTSAALAFGDYDPIGTNASAAATTTGQISVTCSKGASSLTVGMGFGFQPVGAQRQMKGTTVTDLLSYNLFQPSSAVPGAGCIFPGTIAWTDAGAGLLALSAAPSKTPRLYNVCGSIPGGQDVAVDTYSDTVNAVLNF